MYPECRHVRPGGSTCNAPALKGSYWCYFHAHLHARQATRSTRRLANGRFTSGTEEVGSEAHPGANAPERACGETKAGAAIGSTSLELPSIEDAASIQLALIDVLQALAANRLDPRRAGLLLYGLQVASANLKHNRSHGDVRVITHTEDGTPLAPQNYGFDVDDFENLVEEEEQHGK